MMKYKASVVVGTYRDREGNTKNKYQDVGVVLEGEKGPYLLLDRHFNPAGIQNPDNRSTILINLFEPRRESSNTDFSKVAEAIDDEIQY